MKTFFNIIRTLTGGIILWIIYMLLSFIFSLTIVLNPIGKSMRQMAKLVLWPFGKDIIRDNNKSKYDRSFGIIFNIIWFPVGLTLSIIHIILGIIYFISIIGIPAGIVMFKISKAILFPIGIKVVNQKELIQNIVKKELKSQMNGKQDNKCENVSLSNGKTLNFKNKSKNKTSEFDGKLLEISDLFQEEFKKMFSIIFKIKNKLLIFIVLLIIIQILIIIYVFNYDYPFLFGIKMYFFELILLIFYLLYTNIYKKITNKRISKNLIKTYDYIIIFCFILIHIISLFYELTSFYSMLTIRFFYITTMMLLPQYIIIILLYNKIGKIKKIKLILIKFYILIKKYLG